jgi:DNA invertase Pin-like site-specific DNA recombinase
MSAPVRPEQPRAYSYIRFSTPEQARGDSLDRQKDKAAKWAAEHGIPLDTELKMTDAGVSAYSGRNARTGALGGFLEAVQKGYVPEGSYLLVENIDRLSRDHILEAQTLFQQLILAGITVVTLTNGEQYSKERLRAEPEAIFLVVLEQIRANRESARKAQLVADAKARKKQRLIQHGIQGEPYTRQTPAWIRWSEDAKRYELIPERAALVREIFERADTGHGIDRIAKDFNQRGIDTWGGRPGQRKADHWRGSYIRKILLNTAPIGTFTPHTTTHDEVTRARRDQPMAPVENMFPAAVPEDLYWRVHRRLSTTAARGRNAGREPKSLVAGLMHCANCGHAVTRVSKGEYVYLVCSRANMRAANCKYLAVPYPLVEEALRTNAKALIAAAPRGKSTAALEKHIDALQANADRLENHTFELADLAARERSVAARRRLSAAETELRDLQRDLRELRAQRDTLTTASVRDRLKAVQDTLTGKGKSVTETNQALRQAIRRMLLDPEQGRIWVQWQHSDEIQDIICVSKQTSWKEGAITTPPIMTETASA